MSKIGLVAAVASTLLLTSDAASFSESSLSKLNSFVKVPRTDSLTSNFADEAINTGGRLITRHLEYLANAGYKSVLSVSSFSSNDTIFNGMPGEYPSSDYEMQLLHEEGLEARYVSSSLTVNSAKSISQMMTDLPKPLYVHCYVGYTATLFTQLHYYLTSQIDAEEIYPNSLAMGYDYQNNTDAVRLINSLTGLSSQTHPEAIEQTLANGESSYKYYDWSHRLGDSDNFFNIGQILSTHVDSIKAAGYKTVISMRQTGESTVRLSSDASSGSIDNWEFSDSNGMYDVTLEAGAIEAAGIQHYYLPLVSGSADTWTLATFEKYAPVLQQAVASGEGPVLVHCASGYRSSAFTLTYIASTQKQCSDWVMEKGWEVGFDFSGDADVLSFAKQVLSC